MTDDIDERLRKLVKGFDELLGNSCLKPENSIAKQTTEDDLVKLFGLTPDQAKIWLEDEPNFVPSDGFLHRKPSDKDLTESLDAQDI